jgi:hypothetical protein
VDLVVFIQNKKKTQPYLIRTMELHGDEVYFVVVDASKVEVESSLLRAMQVLYKVYHIFSLKFQNSVKLVF